MAGLLERINSELGRGEVERRYSIDTWIQDYLLPSFAFQGTQYPYGLNTSWSYSKVQEFSSSLPGHAAALRRSPPAFAAQMVRALTLSQARFTWRNPPSHTRTPRRKFGTPALAVLERPWPNGTTGELVSRMEWHAGLAGNAYVYRGQDRLRVLRPDWVVVVYGSELQPDEAAHALDAELLGYVYVNGGLQSGNPMHVLLPDEVAHWSPIPDPEAAGLGMSWITPALREIQGDMAATEHKLKFFEHGATPNLVVTGLPASLTPQQFEELVDKIERRHTGLGNAYRTMYLTAGADATVVGADLKQLDFKATQGAGETRIAFLSRVPAPLLGISEGLAGSSLNAGNFGQARRSFADTWVFPTLQDLASCLQTILDVPDGGELWYDVADMPLLHEDAKDAADIEQVKANTIRQLVDGGFEPASVVAAVTGQDMNLLKHTGKLSVQLQAPTSDEPADDEDDQGQDEDQDSGGDAAPDNEDEADGNSA